MRFRDRVDAGRRLAEQLKRHNLGNKDVVVLGLPRGGVPVAFEAAQALGAPLDVIMVRKLGVPFQPELAMGAIGEGGVRILNSEVLRSSGVDEADLAVVERRERAELERRALCYRGERPRVALRGCTAVIIDDGIATGSTARAACQVARAQGAERVVVAVPAASRSSIAELGDVCDEVVCLEAPELFYAVGEWYRDFSQTSDDEVVALLHRAAVGVAPTHVAVTTGGDPPIRDEEVEVSAGAVRLAGHLTVPEVLKRVRHFALESNRSLRAKVGTSVANINVAGDRDRSTWFVPWLHTSESTQFPQATVESDEL